MGNWFLQPVYKNLILNGNVVSINSDLYEISKDIKTSIDIIVFDDNFNQLFSTVVYSKSKADKYKKEIQKIIDEAKRKENKLKREIDDINTKALEQIKSDVKNNFQNIFQYECRSTFDYSIDEFQTTSIPTFDDQDKDKSLSETTTTFSYKS